MNHYNKKNSMIIKHIYSIIILFLLFGCSSRTIDYRIQGTLPSSDFDGELIYLVHFENTSPQPVDSTVILNGTVKFEGNGEEGKMLRMRPSLRLRSQELIIITEPGVINVIVDSISSSSGTLQNEALQKWKDQLLIDNMLGTEYTEDDLKVVISANMFPHKRTLVTKTETLWCLADG